jgi:hypothetical protein
MRPQHILSAMTLLMACDGISDGVPAECEVTCASLYDENECGLMRPGRSSEELKETCIDACADAMAEPQGEVGDYEPYERMPSSVSVELENQAQAELWMECIADTSCEALDDGYCAPIW